MTTCQTVPTFDGLIQTAGDTFAIDPALLKAHVSRESAFDPRAYRYEPNVQDASYGLAQVRFKVAKGLGFGGIPDGLYAPYTNLFYAAKLIRQNLDYARGDLATAVSAYNASFGNPPSRTGRRASDGRFVNQGYVDDVLACVAHYAADFVPASGGDGLPTVQPFRVERVGPLTIAAVALAVLLVGLALVFRR